MKQRGDATERPQALKRCLRFYHTISEIATLKSFLYNNTPATNRDTGTKDGIDLTPTRTLFPIAEIRIERGLKTSSTGSTFAIMCWPTLFIVVAGIKLTNFAGPRCTFMQRES